MRERTIEVLGLEARRLGCRTKHVPWDESIRVPFLVRNPELTGRKRRWLRAVLNTPDIMRTLLGLAGMRIPDGVDGSDFSRLCRSGTAPRESAALLQFPVSYGEALGEGFAEYRGLRTERHTYVKTRGGPWLLYDNQTDPYQMHNLCASKQHQATLGKLDRMPEQRLKSQRDEFLSGDDYVRQFGYQRNHEITIRPRHFVSPWKDWESTLATSS